MKRKNIIIFLLFLILIWSLFPILWGLRTSLLDEGSLRSKELNLIPKNINLENYSLLLGFDESDQNMSKNFKKALINSFISCAGATIVVILVSSIAGYVFSKIDFFGNNIIFGLVIATMTLPAYAVMIPLYKIVINIGLLDTYTGIILIYSSAFIPLGLWLMRSHFNTIPDELEEAAMIAGASRFKSFLTILPLVTPGVISVAILTFLNTWSQFVIPLVFAPNQAKPLTVLITEYVGKHSINYGLMSSAGMLTIIPPLIIVIFLNRYLISGLTSGAVKG
ncbi:carbohydrate ABC transporter permease [Halanaerobium congolense]|uniref:carbohydrate ABC transporter permease n=1 Tax=Halanaerobium congolense TaxID=54121 RepID=UPI0008884C89|nr:carbohydrate ABC transporter permease [Halanaerobium congolense]SDL03200.1 carbohydrate ABC transporter membrane protein 2, CUT1 family [Halanaerobium congolense]SDN12458.1 carbohydrate ABC transporter membrane protein 2, CUT1 family [Halanaerobium congolense]